MAIETIKFKLSFFYAVIAAAFSLAPAFAGDGVAVTSITTTRTAATPSGPYVINGDTIRYGQGDNVQLDTATVGSLALTRSAIDKPSIAIQRIDNANSSGERLTLFYSGTDSGSNINLEGDEASSMEVAMNDDYITSGGLDVFLNVTSTGGAELPNNIERVDFIIDGGMILPTTPSLLSEVGTIANEKQGNNSYQIAMITGLDSFGEPNAYGSLATIEGNVDYGNLGRPKNSSGTDLRNIWMRNAPHPSGGSNGPVEYVRGETNFIGMSFVSFAAMGATAGQTVYGYSLFPLDVTNSNDLVGLTNVPLTTQGSINGGDIYGGTFAIFSSNAAEAETQPGGTAELTGVKTVEIYDPNTQGLYAIPGNDVVYTINVTNIGNVSPSADSLFLVDTLPSEVTFYNDDLDDSGPFTDAIGFVDSSSGLTFNFATDAGFSSSATAPINMTACNYTPTAGYDANIKHICFQPSGTLASGTSNPSFALKFRAQIK